MNYRLSKWCHSFKINNDITALFHSISMSVLYLLSKDFNNLETEAGIKSLDKDTFNALVEEKFLVLSNYKEFQELISIRDKLLKDISLEMMYLIVTDGCNLRCRYCFEETPCFNLPFNPTLMDVKTANASIDLFVKLAHKYGKKNRRKIIHLYGGEPLLNFEIIKVVTEKLNKIKKYDPLFKDCKLVIITNGTLFNDEIVKFIIENNIAVGISIDGPENINNLYRISKIESFNVFKKSLDFFRLLKEKGADVGMSAVLTPELIKDFNKTLNFFTEELGIESGMSFNILHFNPELVINPQYFRISAIALIRSFIFFRKLGIYEERMMRKVNSFINREVIYADCGVVGNQIVISPDGKVGVCQDFIKPRKYFENSVFNKDYDPFSSGLFNNWKKRSPLFMKKCHKCEALSICGGGCPASVELKTGDRWNVDERICQHSKLTLRWLIKDSFNKIKKSCEV